MASIPFDHFDVLTFDCYGTLIDWESGLLAGLRAILDPRGVAADEEDLLARYAGHESAIESGPYLRYREVLARGGDAVCRELGVTASPDELAAFGGSVVDWPPFPDFGGGARPAQGTVRARGHHQLRRRPVRGLEPASRRRLRLRHHRPAVPELQAGPAQLRGRVRAHRAAEGADPARGPEPVPRPCPGQGHGHDHGLDQPPTRPERHGRHAARRRDARPHHPGHGDVRRAGDRLTPSLRPRR